MTTSQPSFQSIFGDELDDYLKSRKEQEYLLVDVREPAEYEQGHIPGAKLLPLGQIEARIDELDTDKELIFYCASGNRSRVASMLVAESGLAPKAVVNVEGGYYAWDGKVLTDFPRVELFGDLSDRAAVLKTAMNLEKGAWLFYRSLREEPDAAAFRKAAETLVKLEHRHAEILYRYWRQTAGEESPPPFQELFDELPGDVLESGQSLDQALAAVRSLPLESCAGFADLALDIEYRAYDLYRNLAVGSKGVEEQETYFRLASQEKGHIRLIAATLKECFSS